ncbi:nicotinate-nucleotide--dimethylbenzimidazole phosphoribosyltransferase [Mariprofundus ferrinatatus]|uniref:Nicotinate-nucleotide--dimethylbenzimidazole phosphoribosyltransferase n=1 Tax=Mariprofundus ferrinatatus TaxID=1921087 RepID=A0A2K8L129_9PROT|nr:nicotinate-nucleotide--dimethylbenzimidazole phosphoribosyltransferase [Mariprofundus ferrinatatus]ATX81020.1 nicotinate-nucleotide--dimethylbenzimidazole phosphoribosyltransferase [Mariprofundus ferrinatatus]
MMEIPVINPESEHYSSLLQPAGCISRLEDVANWFAKRQGKELPDQLKPAIVLFAADHGVAASLSHQDSRSGTAGRVAHATSSDSVIRKLAKEAGASLSIVNLGVRDEITGVDSETVRESGSGDIRVEPAMSQEEYWEAVGIGEELAARAISDGANLLATSSLASGDHVSVAALLCELAGVAPEEALESGSHESYPDELMALEASLERARGTPSHDILRELGGLELAAMAGFFRAAARKGVPVLLDGKASAVAALAATAWDVRIAGWLLASFVSDESAHRIVLEELGLEAMMHLKRSLSGGKGAALLMPLLQASLTLQRGLATIED